MKKWLKKFLSCNECKQAPKVINISTLSVEKKDIEENMKKIQNKIQNESNIKNVEQNIFASEFVHNKKSLSYKLNGTEINGVVDYTIDHPRLGKPKLTIQVNLSKATINN